MDDEIGPLLDESELVVGDEARDLDDGWRSGSSRSSRDRSRPASPACYRPAGEQHAGACPAATASTATRWPPSYARPGDAGADLVALTAVRSRRGGGRALVPTGVAVAIPPGYAGLVLPRSGLALRHGVTCLTRRGLIDSGYRGELQVLLVNHDPDEDYTVERGDRIAQLVIVGVEEAEFVTWRRDGLGEAERGSGGFGHTGT